MREDSARRWLLGVSVAVNLGLLGFFKYFDFFVTNLREAFTLMGAPINLGTLEILLPVGISFYTFQTLSYTIDIYRGKIAPTRDPVSFFAFVAFFPQLVAGPIERASNLLPQFQRSRTFDLEDGKDGLRQILLGLFKKVVIADTCGLAVDDIFGNYGTHSSGTLALGLFYFSFQVYGDFSGYSDIAIGTARLFGFRLMKNFAYPYFSRDMAELWRRWHISLTTWFRDYVYLSLGGSRGTPAATVRNVVIIFVVSGLWHGAAWTYVLWGALHALYVAPLVATGLHRRNTGPVAPDRALPSIRELVAIMSTFALMSISWILFRSASLPDALAYTERLGALQLFPLMHLQYLPLVALLTGWEWFQRHREHALEIGRFPLPLRWLIYCIATWLILYYFGEERAFIYFQF